MSRTETERVGRKQAEAVHVRIEQMGRTISYLQDQLHEKNLELDALHYVWCSGGCAGGVHRYSDQGEKLTAEIVGRAVSNARRLALWYVNRAGNRRMAEKIGSALSGEDLSQAWKAARQEIDDAVKIDAGMEGDTEETP